MPNCIIPFCGNRGSIPGVQYFRVTESRREQWLRAIGRGLNDKLTAYSRICSVHFKPDDFQIVENGKLLKFNAVPVLKLRPIDIRKQLFTKRPSKLRAEACGADGKADESILDDSSISAFQQPSTSSQNFSRLEQPSTRTNVRSSPEIKQSFNSNLNMTSRYVPLEVPCNTGIISDLNGLLDEALSKMDEQPNTTEETHINYDIINDHAEMEELPLLEDEIKIEETVLDDIKPSVHDIMYDNNSTGGDECFVRLTHISQEIFSCERCDFHTIRKTHLLAHMKRIHSVAKVYACNHCNYKTIVLSSLKTHVMAIHQGVKEFKCNICTFATAYRQSFKTHLLVHGKEKPLKCSECSYRTAYKGSLNRHFRCSHKTDSRLRCKVCGLQCPNKPRLESHVRKHSGEKPFVCNKCPYKTAHLYVLKLHMKNHEKNSNSDTTTLFSCSHCSFKTPYKASLDNHIVIHSEEQPFSCNFCDFRTKHKRCLAPHVKIHTGRQQYSCHICQFTTAHKSSLKMHVLSHKAKKPFACDSCNFSTVTEIRLKIHMLKHSEIKPFKCDLCTYTTAYKNNFVDHKRRCHDKDLVKRFSCKICDYKSAYSASLKVHMKSHSSEKPFCCSKCDHRTAHKSALTVHMLIHTGKKLQKCYKCHYATYTKAELGKHMRSHSNEKPFCCSECDFRTAYKSHLTAHLRIHTGEKSYKCDKCHYATHSKSQLRKHVNVHSK